MNVGEMQRKLNLKAVDDSNHRFDDLYSLLYAEGWLENAYDHIRRNRGSRTAGADGVTKGNFEEARDQNLAHLKKELQSRTFEPLPSRRVYIREIKAGGRIKIRPIGIPALRDRIVQQAVRMVLEPIWEADFSPCSHGFRPYRSTQTLLAALGRHLMGTPGQCYQWIIEGDISSYFDSIPHRKLIKSVKKRVKDDQMLSLLWAFLKSGIMEEGEIRNSMAGTPQGGIVSPLLSNIYLHSLDRYMEENYLSLSKHYRTQRRRQGLSNFLYLRYADDFIVLCNGTKKQAEAMKEELSIFLHEELKLTLSMEKTKITHITDGFDFVGYPLSRSTGRSGNMVPRIKIPRQAVDKLKGKLKSVLNPRRTNASVRAKILAVNRIVRGWCHYYKYSSAPSQVFGRMEYELFWLMAQWLGRKYKISIPRVMKRFHPGNSFWMGRYRLVMPSEIKAVRPNGRTPTRPYQTVDRDITYEDIFEIKDVWEGQDRREGSLDLRALVIERDGSICALCGLDTTEWECQVDHIVRRSMFKRPRDADALDNLQVLCTPCHRKKTTKGL